MTPDSCQAGFLLLQCSGAASMLWVLVTLRLVMLLVLVVLVSAAQVV